MKSEKIVNRHIPLNDFQGAENPTASDENDKNRNLRVPMGLQGVENFQFLKFFIFYFFDLFERFYINSYGPDLSIARRSGRRSHSTHFILSLQRDPI